MLFAEFYAQALRTGEKISIQFEDSQNGKPLTICENGSIFIPEDSSPDLVGQSPMELFSSKRVWIRVLTDEEKLADYEMKIHDLKRYFGCGIRICRTTAQNILELPSKQSHVLVDSLINDYTKIRYQAGIANHDRDVMSLPTGDVMCLPEVESLIDPPHAGTWV